ncbi:ROK family protein [Sinorhizobium meliloti]|uniref:ROK family protein n=1 Tax=Rhizobium meliloti TaxID=382 RepID=UPI000FD7BD47|nr:ROK family protein [Sinorhizobium meliloti]RVJ55124.1 ROK family protein [Sinorhizobium meliloti]
MTLKAASETIAVAEIGGTSVKIGFADHGVPLEVTRTFSTSHLRRGAPATQLAGLLQCASVDAGLTIERVVATVPGFIGRDCDTIIHAANIPELNGIRLASELASTLSVPVQLERDVVLQLLGESASGAIANECEVLAVYFGTGIGAAYLGENGIFRGGGWALEIGHMPVLEPGDRQESPKRIEAYASGATLVDLASAHGVSVKDLFQAAAQSPKLYDGLDDILWQQAITVARATVLFSPRIILLGGGVIDMDGYPRDTLTQRVFGALPHAGSIHSIDIRWATLGWQAAIFGAVRLGDMVA